LLAAYGTSPRAEPENRDAIHFVSSLLTLGLLVLPTAALWAPAFAGFLGFAGIDQTRLRIKLVCGAVAWIAAVWAAPRQAGAEESGLRFFFVFPVVSLLGWLLAARIGLAGILWPAAPGPGAG